MILIKVTIFVIYISSSFGSELLFAIDSTSGYFLLRSFNSS